jgi:O-antigen/teichoic acid export membrane protein
MATSKKDNSYRSILKSNTIFGGVRVFQMLIGIIRGKFVAMFLGPEGMGLAALFNSTFDSVRKVASLGLNLAIVKDVAAAKDPQSLASTVLAIRRLLAFTATAGLLVCLLFASQISRLTFGNETYTYQILLLGAVVFLTIVWEGEMSVLQGLHKVKTLSAATLVGSLTGLCIGVPLYWLWGYDGIVPAMLAYAVVMAVFYTVSVRRHVSTAGLKFVWREHRSFIKALLLMGLILMVGDTIGSIVQYLVNIFIRTYGSLDHLGLWQGANSLTNQFAAVVFAALAMDYLPRLTALAKTGEDFSTVVDRQTEISSLLIMPLSVLFILFAPLVVRLLLTTAYLPIVPLLRVLAVALALRTAMIPLGYVTLAKDNKKVFFWLEAVWGNVQLLGLLVLGYHFGGIMGLGVATLIDNLLCLLIYTVVNRSLYGYLFSGKALGCIILSVTFASAALWVSVIPHEVASYSLMAVLAAAATLISFHGLKKRLRNDTVEEKNEENDKI